jgi:hypothetical protein
MPLTLPPPPPAVVVALLLERLRALVIVEILEDAVCGRAAGCGPVYPWIVIFVDAEEGCWRVLIVEADEASESEEAVTLETTEETMLRSTIGGTC